MDLAFSINIWSGIIELIQMMWWWIPILWGLAVLKYFLGSSVIPVLVSIFHRDGGDREYAVGQTKRTMDNLESMAGMFLLGIKVVFFVIVFSRMADMVFSVWWLL